MMPKSLFGRAVIMIIAPMALVQSVLVYIFMDRHLEDVTRRFAGGVAGEIALLADAFENGSDPAGFAELTRLIARHEGLKIEIEPLRPLPPPPVLGYLSVVRRQITNDLNERLGRAPLVYSSEDPNYLEIFIELKKGILHVWVPRTRLRTATTNLLMYWMFGLTLVLVTVALIFLRNSIKPILRLTRAAENFGRGVDDVDFKPSGATEIRRAGAAFIEMRRRIKRHIEQRTTMLAAVSHDLRTPLTRMKLELEMMSAGTDVDGLKADVAEIEHMVNEYLAFTQDQTSEEAVEQDLRPLLREVTEQANRHEANVSLSVAAAQDEALSAAFRYNALKRCLTNLLENARNYGTAVRLDAVRRGNVIEISVDDDGPGIPPEQIEAAMTPFVRLDSARNPNRAGVGLGLAIARDIARSHGGDLILARSDLGGLSARIQLPARQA